MTKQPECTINSLFIIFAGVNPNPPVEPPVPSTPPPPTTPAPAPAYCNMTFDDVAVIRGEIFAFKVTNYFVWNVRVVVLTNSTYLGKFAELAL